MLVERTGGKAIKPLNIAAYQHLFVEMAQYAIEHASESLDAEARLHSMGKAVGERLFDVLYLRERGYKRETKLIGVLTFIINSAWKTAFGRVAELHETQDEYIISDSFFVLNKYASPPPDASDSLNCGGAFAAGFVEAI
ncbi:TRAPP I complex, subunit 5, partial [Perkinsus sp. BL_2016]